VTFESRVSQWRRMQVCDVVGSHGDWLERGGLGDEGRAPSFNYTVALENNRIAEKCLTPFVLST